MKLGIFGGTFDPIHNAHLVLAEQCLEQCALDEVWFLPAGSPPHKSRFELAESHHRLRMVELAIAGHRRFAVSSYEVDRSGPSYTVETLEQFHHDHRGHQLFFLMGSDSLHEFHAWRSPERILQLAQIVVVQRADTLSLDDFEKTSSPEEMLLFAIRPPVVEIPAMGISSTDCRKRVQEDRSIRYLVPRSVECYIETHGLYQDLSKYD